MHWQKWVFIFLLLYYKTDFTAHVLGVKTGLQLLFSLIRFSWMQPSYATSLCNETLRTAASVMSNMPPLTLSNSNKIPALGMDCLKDVQNIPRLKHLKNVVFYFQVTQFLKSVFDHNSGADAEGSRLACELLLTIAFQRGSLVHLLEWIGSMLTVTAEMDVVENGSAKILFTKVNKMYFYCCIQLTNRICGNNLVSSHPIF